MWIKSVLEGRAFFGAQVGVQAQRAAGEASANRLQRTLWLGGLALLLPLVGCHCGASSQAATKQALHRSVDKAQSWGKLRSKKGRSQGTRVMVDDKLVAVMRYGELPAVLRARFLTHETYSKRVFQLAEYFEALGIALEDLEQILLMSSRGRFVDLPPSLLLERREAINFSFSASTKGKSRMEWANDIWVSNRIDKLTGIRLYTDKAKVLSWNEREDRFERGGQPVRLEQEQGKRAGQNRHPRVYVNGKLALRARGKHQGKGGIGKAKKEQNQASWFGRSKDSLGDYLAKHGVELAKVKSIDFVSRDALAVRLKGKDLREQLELLRPETELDPWELRHDGELKPFTAIMAYHQPVPTWSHR